MNVWQKIPCIKQIENHWCVQVEIMNFPTMEVQRPPTAAPSFFYSSKGANNKESLEGSLLMGAD